MLLVFLGMVALVFLVTSTGAGEYSEAPQFRERVLAGTLPPVGSRIPSRPLLVQPVESMGTYGGVWRMGTLELYVPGFVVRTIGYEPLVRWDSQWRRVVPGVAERWSVNTAGTHFRFHLREGMCWSDGVSFTADDILFWREHVAANPKWPDRASPWLAPGGRLPDVVRISDHVVEFRFDRPNGMFLQWLATPRGLSPVRNPKHVLSKSFPAFNPDAKKDAETLGYDSAWAWYQALAVSPLVPDADERAPSLHAWNIKSVDRDSGGRPLIRAVRNPYYWKIDPGGKQLPYIDEVHWVVASTADELLEMAASGALHMQDRYLGSADQEAVLRAAEESGRIRINRRIPSSSNTAAISLNLNHTDPVLAEFFGQKKVRIALSLAIDRDRMIREVFRGKGRPYQVAPRPGSKHYHQRLATQYLEYDPERAKRLLAEAGYHVQSSDDTLVDENGAVVKFTIQVAESITADATDIANALARNWRELGLRVSVEPMTQFDFYELKRRNGHDVVLWSGDGGMDPLLEPRYYLPMCDESNYALRWALWYENPMAPDAVEPPQSIREMFSLYSDVMQANDEGVQAQLFSKLLEKSADEFLVIGCTLPESGIGIVHPELRNVPDLIYESWNYPQPAPVNPCQFYFKKK